MNRVLRHWVSTCGLLSALALGATTTAYAASSVMIWPVDPVIEEDQRATALWLENRSTDNVSLQIRVFGWSQSGTEENFENQDQMIASPPLAVIPAGQRQLVRLMNTGPVPEGKELSFRVLVDELPEAEGEAKAGGSSSAMGVKLQIRYSIPLFVNGKGVLTRPRPGKTMDASALTTPDLRWRIVREGETFYLAIRNSGNAHARLTAVQWVGNGSTVNVNSGLLGYALAQSEMRWPLVTPPPAGSSLVARINGADTALKLVPQ